MDITSLLIYLVVISTTIFCAYRVDLLNNRKPLVNQKKRGWKKIRVLKSRDIIRIFYLLLMILIPSVLAGLRSETVGTDILIYGKNMMIEAERSTSFSGLLASDTTMTEVGYQLYAFIVSRFFSGLGWWLFFTQLFIMTFFVLGINNFRNDISLWKAMAVFMFCFYHLSFNIMRQFMAMSVLLFAFYYLTKKKYVIFVLLIIFAATFHTAAFVVGLIILCLWTFRDWFKSKTNKTIATLLVLIAAASFKYLLSTIYSILGGFIDRYARYVFEGSDVTLLTMITSPSFLMLLAMFLFSTIIIKDSKASELDNFLYIIVLVGVVGKFLQIYMDIMYRMGIYLLLFLCLYMPRTFNYKYKICFKDRRKLFLLILFMYWLCDCMLSSHSSTAVFELSI